MAEQETRKTKGIPLPKRYKPMDDYELRFQLDARGRERRVPVYKGPFLHPLHSDELYRYFRIAVLAGAFLILAGAFVLLFFDKYAVYPYEGLFTLIPLTLALFPFAYMLMGFFRLPRKNEKTQRDTYVRSVLRIRRSALAIAILGGLSLLLWIVFLLAVKDIVLSAWDALYTGMIVLILLIGLCLFFFTGKLSYEVEEAEAPHDLQDAANARKAE